MPHESVGLTARATCERTGGGVIAGLSCLSPNDDTLGYYKDDNGCTYSIATGANGQQYVAVMAWRRIDTFKDLVLLEHIVRLFGPRTADKVARAIDLGHSSDLFPIELDHFQLAIHSDLISTLKHGGIPAE